MRFLIAMSLIAVAVPDRPDRTPRESLSPQAQIVGDWHYTGTRADAPPQPAPPGYFFRITATESFWMENGKPSPGNGFTARIAIDWTKNPVTIDLAPKHGGQVLQGILKLEGDRLTLAWSNNPPRPIDFSAPQNIHFFTRIKS